MWSLFGGVCRIGVLPIIGFLNLAPKMGKYPMLLFDIMNVEKLTVGAAFTANDKSRLRQQ